MCGSAKSKAYTSSAGARPSRREQPTADVNPINSNTKQGDKKSPTSWQMASERNRPQPLQIHCRPRRQTDDVQNERKNIALGGLKPRDTDDTSHRRETQNPRPHQLKRDSDNSSPASATLTHFTRIARPLNCRRTPPSGSCEIQLSAANHNRPPAIKCGRRAAVPTFILCTLHNHFPADTAPNHSHPCRKLTTFVLATHRTQRKVSGELLEPPPHFALNVEHDYQTGRDGFVIFPVTTHNSRQT